MLPTVLAFIVRETHNWFSNSPNRIQKYREIYQTLESKTPKKIPGMSATLWLAHLEAMKVIVKQWDALKLHFQMAASNERCHTAKLLSEAYNQNELYMLFTRKVLKEVVGVNKLFQAQSADVTKLTEDLLNMYRNVMQIVVEPIHLSECPVEQLLGVKFLDHVMPVSAINFGFEFGTAASNVPLTMLKSHMLKSIVEVLWYFVVELIKEVQMRLPENIAY